MASTSTPGGILELTGVEGQPHLMRLTFPAGVSGTATVDVDGVNMEPIDLAAIATRDAQVLLPITNHNDRSVGLSWVA